MSSISRPERVRGRRIGWAAGAAALAVLALAGCSTSPKASTSGSGGSTTITVVAAENFWPRQRHERTATGAAGTERDLGRSKADHEGRREHREGTG